MNTGLRILLTAMILAADGAVASAEAKLQARAELARAQAQPARRTRSFAMPRRH